MQSNLVLPAIMDTDKKHSPEFEEAKEVPESRPGRESLYLEVHGNSLPPQTRTVLFLCQYCGWDSFDVFLVRAATSTPEANCGHPKDLKSRQRHQKPDERVADASERRSKEQDESDGAFPSEQTKLCRQSSSEPHTDTSEAGLVPCNHQTDAVFKSPPCPSPEIPIPIPNGALVIESWDSVDWLAQQCQLPVVVGVGQRIAYCGLSAVLRRIVKKGHERDPAKNLEALLGYKQACLKKCAEVSPCTKLCEVDIYEDLPVDSTTPTVLLDLERLLSSPPVISSKFLGRKAKDRRLGRNGEDRQMAAGPTEDTVFFQPPSALQLCDKRQIKVSKNIYKKGQKAQKGLSVKDGGSANEGREKPPVLESAKGRESVETLAADRETQTSSKSGLCQARTPESLPPHIPIKEVDARTSIAQGATDIRPSAEQSAAPIAPSSASARPDRLFVEGLYVTLADFALFLGVHSFCQTIGRGRTLLGSLPRVWRWYGRMWSVPGVRRCAESCGLRQAAIAVADGPPQSICMSEETEAEAEVKMKIKAKVKTDGKVEVKTEDKAEVKMEVKEEVKEEVKTEDKAEVKTEDKVEAKPEVKEEVTVSFNQDKLRSLHISQLPSVKVRVAEILAKLEACDVNVEVEDFSENVELPWDSFPADVNPSQDVSANRAHHKRQQIESLVAAVRTVAKAGDVIVDFCSGGGHVGIVLAHCLPDCRVVLVENNEESVKRAEDRLARVGLTNAYSCQSNLNYFTGKFDVGVSLHACGVATDLVLGKCLACRAAFVCSPCCYGSARNTRLLTYPRSQCFLASTMSYDDHLLACHVAEQTSWKFETEMAKQAKVCMSILDTDRAQAAREEGYEVRLCSLSPETCSPKNNLLIGTPPQR